MLNLLFLDVFLKLIINEYLFYFVKNCIDLILLIKYNCVN